MKFLIDNLNDPNLWNHQYIWARDNIINNELQMYVDPVEDPLLFGRHLGKNAITADVAPQGFLDKYGQPFISGLATTHKKLAVQYGSVRFRATVPTGAGLWPALWLLREYPQWPKGGVKPMLPEIDVMEAIGGPEAHCTVHYYTDQNDGGSMVKETGTLVVDTINEPHDYWLEWNERRLILRIDETHVVDMATPEDMQGPFHLLVNIAVGGWAGKPDPSAYQATMEVLEIEINTEKSLYDLPDSIKLLGVSGDFETIPAPPNSQTVAERRAEDLKEMSNATDSVVDMPVATRKHVDLATHLLALGWRVFHNPASTISLVDNYLSGQKITAELVVPEFEPTAKNIDKAWSGVMDIMRLVISQHAAIVDRSVDSLLKDQLNMNNDKMDAIIATLENLRNQSVVIGDSPG